MARYVWRDGGFRDPATEEAMTLPFAGKVCKPYVQGDTPAYASPITGDVIDGRTARREDLKKHGCLDAGDLPKMNGGLVRSEKFARKHGLKWEGDA